VNLIDYSGLIVLVGGTIVLLLKFGRQFIKEFKELWD